MFDGVNGCGDEAASTWARGERGERGWRQIDRELRGIAKRRAALDADEARCLREAERAEIWKPLGMVNLIDYLERVLGYAPRTGQQRMQVARALATLPVLTDATRRARCRTRRCASWFASRRRAPNKPGAHT